MPHGHHRHRVEIFVVACFDSIRRLQIGQARLLAVQDDRGIARGIDCYGIPLFGSHGYGVPLDRADRSQDRIEARIASRSPGVDSAAWNNHHIGTDVAGIDDVRTDDIDPATVPIPPAAAPAPAMVIAPTVVVTPSVVVAPTMPMVRVVMAPRRVMPGEAPAVQAGVAMCQSAIGPAPMMSRTRGRVGMPAVCVFAVPMSSMPVRSMPPVSMPAVAACKGRALIQLRRANHRYQCKQTETFHRQGPFFRMSNRAFSAFRAPFELFGQSATRDACPEDLGSGESFAQNKPLSAAEECDFLENPFGIPKDFIPRRGKRLPRPFGLPALTGSLDRSTQPPCRTRRKSTPFLGTFRRVSTVILRGLVTLLRRGVGSGKDGISWPEV